MGATITGPTEADKNLGIKTYVDGLLMEFVQIDTSVAGTHTVDYVVINNSGTATSTREVVVNLLEGSVVVELVESTATTTDTTATTTETTTP